MKSNDLIKDINISSIKEAEEIIEKAGSEELFEKAHNDGDLHPTRPWIWVSSANKGKGDWRLNRNHKPNTPQELDEKIKKMEDKKKETYKVYLGGQNEILSELKIGDKLVLTSRAKKSGEDALSRILRVKDDIFTFIGMAGGTIRIKDSKGDTYILSSTRFNLAPKVNSKKESPKQKQVFSKKETQDSENTELSMRAQAIWEEEKRKKREKISTPKNTVTKNGIIFRAKQAQDEWKKGIEIKKPMLFKNWMLTLFDKVKAGIPLTPYEKSYYEREFEKKSEEKEESKK